MPPEPGLRIRPAFVFCLWTLALIGCRRDVGSSCDKGEARCQDRHTQLACQHGSAIVGCDHGRFVTDEKCRRGRKCSTERGSIACEKPGRN